MINKITTLVFVFWGLTVSHAQIQFRTTCDDISTDNIICDLYDLNGLVLTMGTEDVNGPEPNLLCATGGALHNTNYLAFEAPVGNYFMTFTFSNCMDGVVVGLSHPQIVIYEESCAIDNTVFCDPQCSDRVVSVHSSIFTPGRIYYILADGCAGSFCDVHFEIEEGILNEDCEEVVYIPMLEVTDWQYQFLVNGLLLDNWIVAEGDTTINDQNYRILKEFPLTYIIREDIMERKVYQYDPSSNSERILYDFSLEVGDSLLFRNGNYAQVISIDSVHSNYGYLKKWNFDASGYMFNYIECIGAHHLIDYDNEPFSETALQVLQAYNQCYNIFGEGPEPPRWSSGIQSIEREICANDFISINGELVNTPGIYIDSFKNKLHCDSLIEIDLKVFDNPSDTIHAEICSGESFVFKGRTFTSPGLNEHYVETNEFCDSLYVVDLDVFGFNLIESTLCAGDEFIIDGTVFNENNPSGTIILAGTATNGCDSIIQVFLNYVPFHIQDTLIKKCPLDSITFMDSLIVEEGVYEFVLPSDQLCDTIVTLIVLDLDNDPNCDLTSIKEEEEKNILQIAPNPFSDILTISSIENDVECVVMASNGAIVFHGDIDKGETSLNLEGLTRGVYFIKFLFQDKLIVRKVIKN